MDIVMIVPDLHIWDKNLNGRVDYVAEVKGYASQILSIVEEKFNKGYNVNVVFAGDIFHKGFNNFEELIYWYSYFLELASMSSIYSVIGNHELSYSKDNPFWLLTSELTTTRRFRGKAASPKGNLPIIKVPDGFRVGDVYIDLVHYGSRSKIEEGVKCVGIFHDNFLSKEILNVMTNKYGRDLGEFFIDYNFINENSNAFEGYRYVFIGHMHRAMGSYGLEHKGNLTEITYTQSLGRTNHLEVDDRLERKISLLTISGDNIEKSSEIITLQSRAECVLEDVIEKTQGDYLTRKDLLSIEKAKSLGLDPLEDLRKFIEDEKRTGELELFNCYKEGTIPANLIACFNTIDKGGVFS